MAFNQQQKDYLIAELQKALDCVKQMPVQKDCASCVNYDMGGANRVCRIAGVAPPPEVVASGCEAYIYDSNSPPF